jgi:sigma-B regulation protein RsbU (phosphoserine phosphatase)
VAHRFAPAQMLATLNERLRAARLDARFIAMLFAVYEASARRLTIANAGGPHPLLLRDGMVETIRVDGVPLGLLPSTAYDEIALDLRPGDVVVLASDGIHETENSAHEELGIERLSTILGGVTREDAGYQIAQKIMQATDAYAGAGTPPHDDRTLLVLRVTEESSADFSKLPIIY